MIKQFDYKQFLRLNEINQKLGQRNKPTFRGLNVSTIDSLDNRIKSSNFLQDIFNGFGWSIFEHEGEWNLEIDNHFVRKSTSITGTFQSWNNIIELVTTQSVVVAGQILGQIDFYAPEEASGSDAILVGASIWAEAAAAFTASVNATDLVLATGASESAIGRVYIKSDGKVGIGTDAPDELLHINGNVKVAGSVELSGSVIVGDLVDSIDIAALNTAVGLNTTHRGLVTGNPHVVTKSEVGLSAVPNTDFTTPVANNTTHRGLTNNPHSVNAGDVGLHNNGIDATPWTVQVGDQVTIDNGLITGIV